MMHKAWCSIEEVPYYFSGSSIKLRGHMGWKIDDSNQIWVRLLGRSQLSNPSDLPCLDIYSGVYCLSIILQLSGSHFWTFILVSTICIILQLSGSHFWTSILVSTVCLSFCSYLADIFGHLSWCLLSVYLSFCSHLAVIFRTSILVPYLYSFEDQAHRFHLRSTLPVCMERSLSILEIPLSKWSPGRCIGSYGF